MPVTDLQIVAQYAKSSRTAPSEVYNAACRLLDNHATAAAVIDRVRQYADELRTYCSPAGIAAVYADRLEELLPPRTLDGAESRQDARTPQTQGASMGQDANEAPRGSQ